MSIPRLCQLINAMRDQLQGCSDHFCVIRTNSGMVTNGGCRCLRHISELGLELAAEADLHKNEITGLLPLSEYR